MIISSKPKGFKMSKQLAETIIAQIRALDRVALMCWGSSDFLVMTESEKNLGGLRFTVRNCRTFKGTAFVKVMLDFNDTYTVTLYKQKRLTKKLRTKFIDDPDFKPADMFDIIGEVSGVYNDMLVDIIDGLTGER